ncbi:peptide chain release factor N(5)-glutamine methyltransferase [Rhodobacterales bacterium]|nr:peptide chain release factor N(5)-glutamine methyltransferase [Rhodobacterales bacterium]
MRAGQLYRLVRDRFRAADLPTPELDARLLVSSATGMRPADLIFNEHDEVAQAAGDRAEAFAQQRLLGMPVGRILGEREFYGRPFLLNEATLEPRPDTETLIDAVLGRTGADEPFVLCDIGTGTGAIAVTLLAERPSSFAVASDISQRALECAAGNARLNAVDARFAAVCANYLSAFGAGFDWVISNPPYIRSQALRDLDREVIQHDPLLALDGGESGLDAYLSIVTDAMRVLRPKGRIALEIGFDQAQDLEKILVAQGFADVEVTRDLGGNDRVVTAIKG